MELDEIKSRMDPWFFQRPFSQFPSQKELEESLDNASMKGDIEILDYILEHKDTPKYLKSYVYKNALLSMAAKHGRENVVKYLISRGAEVTVSTLYSVSDPVLLEYLIEHVQLPIEPHQLPEFEDAKRRAKIVRMGRIKKSALNKLSAVGGFMETRGRPGTIVWSEAMGDYYRVSGRQPFANHSECMEKTYLDANNMKKKYTKEQLYHIAKSMGLSVKRDMAKDELCTIISLSK